MMIRLRVCYYCRCAPEYKHTCSVFSFLQPLNRLNGFDNGSSLSYYRYYFQTTVPAYVFYDLYYKSSQQLPLQDFVSMFLFHIIVIHELLNITYVTSTFPPSLQ